MIDGGLPLTPEQAEIVAFPPEVQAMVTAGPGTGKTHTLVARAASLIDRHGLNPGRDLLVLSFSRAAVKEIRSRVAENDSDARYVEASTFDSFATRLLSMFEPGGPWSEKDYEGRIVEATRLLTSNTEAAEHIFAYRHVMVDEIQDLVGERADFVKAVLIALGGGFTLYGDPAQGIYEWQVKGRTTAVGASDLYAWLDSRFPHLKHCALERNHRAFTAVSKTALWAGEKLNSRHPDYDAIRFGLETDVMRLPSGTLDHYEATLSSPTMATAILCRTNGQALVISRELYKRGISHRLQRAATDRVVPPWIALVLNDHERKQIGRSAFRKRAADRIVGGKPDPDEAWRLIKQTDPKGADTLDVSALAQRIRMHCMPDDLVETSRSRLVVSTVHRAKGLEFDRVIICESPRLADENNELSMAEETRVLYVALTRPRREVWHLQQPDTAGVSLHRETGRWVRRGYGKLSWQLYDLEVCGEDTHRDDPAGGFLVKDYEPQRRQEYIANNVKAGDSIQLRLLCASDEGDVRVFYGVIHNEQVVGVTSEQFGRTLYRTLKIHGGWQVRWPAVITDLNVEGVDTVAGTEAAGLRSGLGPSGIWLRVRVGGFGHLVYEA